MALRSLIIRESQVMVDLSVNGVKETLPVVQGILKQNNVKALKGDTAATRLSILLLTKAAKEVAEHDQKQQDMRMETALLAQNVTKYWAKKIKNTRKHGIPLELPIPHPDHISIDPETLEVELKCATVDSVNAAIDLIGKPAEMGADSLAHDPRQNLWTEQTMLTLPCEHIDKEALDFSIPATSLNLEECEGAIHVFR